MIINTAVNGGKLDPIEFSHGRAGRYYDLYAEKAGRERMSMITLINSFFVDNVRSSYSLRAFNLKWGEIKQSSRQTAFREFFEAKVDAYLSQKDSLFSSDFKRYWNTISENQKKIIKAALLRVFRSDNSRIRPEFGNVDYHVFEDYDHSHLINTDLLLDLHVEAALSDPNVNTIFAIVDTGYQLFKFIEPILDHKNNISMYLILHDRFEDARSEKGQASFLFDYFDKLIDSPKKEKYLAKIRDQVKFLTLPIKGHNRHLMLFLNYQKSQVFLSQTGNISGAAVYYYKPGLRTNINPVHISKPTNVLYLLETFARYADRAKNQSGSQNLNTLREIKELEQSGRMEKILDDWIVL